MKPVRRPFPGCPASARLNNRNRTQWRQHSSLPPGDSRVPPRPENQRGHEIHGLTRFVKFVSRLMPQDPRANKKGSAEAHLDPGFQVSGCWPTRNSEHGTRNLTSARLPIAAILAHGNDTSRAGAEVLAPNARNERNDRKSDVFRCFRRKSNVLARGETRQRRPKG